MGGLTLRKSRVLSQHIDQLKQHSSAFPEGHRARDAGANGPLACPRSAYRHQAVGFSS